jgi:hypothetical protein
MTVRPARARFLSEQLEDRTLFSTVLVTAFGATPNDGSNDSYAVQAAINSSKAGDTIFFPAGTYNIDTQIDSLPGNRTYTSDGDATLVGRTSDGEMLKVESDNVKISNLTFNGGGVLVDHPGGGMNQNIVFNNNVFNLNTSGNNPNGITATSGLENSSITNNLFTGYAGAFGIYGYNYNGLTIANNEFVNISAGIHMDVFSPSGNLLVEQNYITGAKGMGMEFQTQGAPATNLVFQDNWDENPNLSSNARSNTNSMAFSLILDQGSNILIQRNVVIAPQKPDGIGERIAFEVGGDNTIVRENYVNGINSVLAMNDGVGSASVIAQDNQWMNYTEGPSITFPSSIRTLSLINNGPSVQLDWDISRGRPGRNSDFGGDPIDFPPISDPSSPGNSDVDSSLIPPTNLVATAINANEIDLTWQDNATGELGYYVERSVDGGNSWVQIAILPFNATSYQNFNLTPSTNVSYRVRTYSAAGQSDYSNIATATTTGGSTAATGGGGTTTPTGGGTTTTGGGGGGTIVVVTPPTGGTKTPPRGTL